MAGNAVKDRPEKLLLSTREVAELLGVSERYVRGKACIPGFPRKVRLGRSVRFRRADVLKWVERL